MKTVRAVLLFLLGFALVALVPACDGGSSSSGHPETLAGSWSGSLSFTVCTCSAGSWAVTVNDNNGVLTGNGWVDTGNCGFYTGVINGTYDRTTGQFVQGLAVGGGETVNFTGTASGGSISGTWVGSMGCQGTFQGSLS